MTYVFKLALWIIGVIVSEAALAAEKPNTKIEGVFVGVATIDDEGTICLQLLSHFPPEPRAEGYFCYEKSDKRYEYIRKHVGPIKVGEEKSIKPFPPKPNQ